MDGERDALVEALKKTAFSPPNDAVALAQNPKASVDGLDLWCVSEFKLSSTGSVEIKFFDRLKALSLLLDYTAGNQDGLRALMEALEDADN